jgi:patatin-like phospholipase/acyl hydrolase
MADQAPLQILSIDGGGVRGISSLYFLKEIMMQIKSKLMHENPNIHVPNIRPCDVFDLICGTGTGGLIALMLGRLDMVCVIIQPLSNITY